MACRKFDLRRERITLDHMLGGVKIISARNGKKYIADDVLTALAYITYLSRMSGRELAAWALAIPSKEGRLVVDTIILVDDEEAERSANRYYIPAITYKSEYHLYKEAEELAKLNRIVYALPIHVKYGPSEPSSGDINSIESYYQFSIKNQHRLPFCIPNVGIMIQGEELIVKAFDTNGTSRILYDLRPFFR